MANNNPEQQRRSMSGQVESAEPGASGTTSTQRPSPGLQRASQSSMPTPTPRLRKTPSGSLIPQSASPAGTSPRTSRNASPIRKDSRPGPLSTPISTQPSAAAIQRALSAASMPQLQQASVSEAVSKLPRAQRSTGGSGDSTPQWPLSPRLKSPPPSATSSRRGSAVAQKKPEGGTAPSITVHGPTPEATPPQGQSSKDAPKSEQEQQEQQQLQAPPKMPSRGPNGKSTLETVQENSGDTTEPSPAAIQASKDLKSLTKLSDDEKHAAKRKVEEGEKQTKVGESESESGGHKSDGNKSDSQRARGPPSSQSANNRAQRPKPLSGKNSYTPLSSAKSRQPEGTRNMTVETETVQSIPQSALNAGDRSGRGENSGSLRLKPSNETIRPKKERKKPSQKARSINQGTASSKADIFEARVASQVDDVNSSDSDETFVYESNPPEQQRRPRHHSRTPSVTSSHSTADQRSGMRHFSEVLDDRKVAGKRSMKFSNNPYNELDSPTGDTNGTVRSHQPRHYGRWGRGGSQASMFDQDSPFTQASKLRNTALNGGRHSRPESPRSPQSVQLNRTPGLFGRGGKKDASFDFDGEGADDERTPLMGTVRTPRNGRHARHLNSSGAASVDEYYGVRQRGRCGRLSGCMLGFCVFAAAILSAVAFLFMSNRPMYDIRVREIQNVLASEQEIMLDLLVGAVNPNPLSITITEMDVNVFAKSKHVGSEKYWREHGYAALSTGSSQPAHRQRRRREQRRSSADNSNPWQDSSGHWHSPSDPQGDLGSDPSTMLLGRIFHFDQALAFEGSPIKRHAHYSVGEVRLMRPGNRTEMGGSERWERVLEYPFELIVRGVLRYQLPISSRMVSAAVGGSVMVQAEEAGAVWSWGRWEEEGEEDGVEDWPERAVQVVKQ